VVPLDLLGGAGPADATATEPPARNRCARLLDRLGLGFDT
jgi:hypothetical protein